MPVDRLSELSDATSVSSGVEEMTVVGLRVTLDLCCVDMCGCPVVGRGGNFADTLVTLAVTHGD